MIIYYKNGDGEVSTYEPNEMTIEDSDMFFRWLLKEKFVAFSIWKNYKKILLNTDFIVQIEKND